MSAAEPVEGEYDYIIVGAGSAGCILANRLSADPAKRVLILEAGGRDNWIWFHIPVGYLFAIGNPRSDWLFKTEPEEGLNGRSLNYPRGKVIGGSSSINAMICMRGQAADYDGWRSLGLPGWGWSDVLPAFKQVEDHFLGAGEHHGSGGGFRVEAPRVSWRVLDAVRDAAPDVILASWCGKKVVPDKIRKRPGWDQIPAVHDGRIVEIKSALILQPGPAALTDGLDAIIAALWPQK